MTDALPTVTFLNNPHAPEVFVDGYSGFFIFNGNVRITLDSLRVDHSTAPGPLNRVVIARLVIPLGSAEALAKELLDFIQKQRTQPQQSAQAPSTVH